MSEHYGVTNGRLKLIHYYKLDEWELFDLQADPDEMKNVYGKPGYAVQRRTMNQELNRLRTVTRSDYERGHSFLTLGFH